MIIPVHHTVVANYPINATRSTSGANQNNFERGHVVALNSSGYAVKCEGGGTNNDPIGLAADQNRQAEAFEWQNRVSDVGSDTAASGQLSVYQGSGGVFYVDVDDDAITTPQGGTVIDGVVDSGATKTPGTPLYASTTHGHLASAQQGSEPQIAIVVENTGDLSTGIPDEYEPGASWNLADDAVNRQWVKIKLTL